jgi:ketosteroid isomerase-like protein
MVPLRRKHPLTPSAMIMFSMLISFAFPTSSTTQDRVGNLRAMVETEYAFAKRSIEKGTQTAFLDFLADEGVMFRPGPVNAKESFTKRPAAPGVLIWGPTSAYTAVAGDMGFTTGPWEYKRKSLTDSTVAWGNFVTIWRYQPDGNWKVEVDIGISHPDEKQIFQYLDTASLQEGKNKFRSISAKQIGAMESELGKRDAQPFKGSWDEEITIFREGSSPLLGKAAHHRMVEESEQYLCVPISVKVSASGDFGYSYGEYSLRQKEKGVYLHIWKKSIKGVWDLLLDIVNPYPAESSK